MSYEFRRTTAKVEEVGDFTTHRLDLEPFVDGVEDSVRRFHSCRKADHLALLIAWHASP